ncbi:acetyltransferase, gnat family [Renibacterium salmoninarum ATCC 33209]|uniref:Acetyltransferase, gnat family n=1 Tax=Renibacterium salmoninarum (strain ATCC 33209 / DSM 20767 / JCM 11484 / NBRC 15589 / NCIMB 2235) TaxID=288705 RepID=A9WVH9_RENSM|nr:GNAT family N-acetyltransferase [Renibacterium salmoninarum]ABY25200.1 acetyltransferase, gnat family [Renibacterium salmoninarum ATCC 33209]
MISKVTLIARTSPLPTELDITTRSLSTEDISALGELYFSAYDAGFGEKSVEAATADITDTFAGKYGNFLADISQVALDESGKIIAAVLVVERSAEDNSPEVPLLIELFTDRDHRRRGLAERLVVISSDLLFQSGHREVSVRVDDSNSAALALYLSLEFRRAEADEDQD